MGNYLSSPNVVRQRKDGRLGHVQYAVCAMQGWRVNMEDSHVVHMFEYLPPPADGPSSLFGIYDGHGGPQVAQFVARHLIDELLKVPDLHIGLFDSAFRKAYISLDCLLRSEINQAELEWFSRLRTVRLSDASYSNESNSGTPFPPTPLVTPAGMTQHTHKRLMEKQHGSKSSLTAEDQKKSVKLSSRFNSHRFSRKTRGEKLRSKFTNKRYSDNESEEGKNSEMDITDEEDKHSSHDLLSSDELADRINPSTEYGSQEEMHVPGRRNSALSETDSAQEKKKDSVAETPIKPRCTNAPKAAVVNVKQPFSRRSNSNKTTATNVQRPPTAVTDHSTKLSFTHRLKYIFSNMIRVGSNSLRSQSTKAHGLAMLAGCTATSVLVTPHQVIVANAGDSRAVLCRGKLAVELSKDHKPTLPEEKARIYTAGGWLEMGRINGNLNLSRAVGDLIYKMDTNLSPEEQIVSVVPDVVFVDIQEEDEFLLLGCDGIWEASTSQEIVDFVLNRVEKTIRLSDILDSLFEELLSPNPTLLELGCDNMTAILVDLHPERRSHQYTKQSVSEHTNNTLTD